MRSMYVIVFITGVDSDWRTIGSESTYPPDHNTVPARAISVFHSFGLTTRYRYALPLYPQLA
jgi:hypothetical protein